MSLPTQNSKTFGRLGSFVAPPPLFLSTDELSVAEHSFPRDIDTATSASPAGESAGGSVGMVPDSPYDFSSVQPGETLNFDEQQIDFSLEEVMVYNATSGHLFLTRPVLSEEAMKPYGGFAPAAPAACAPQGSTYFLLNPAPSFSAGSTFSIINTLAASAPEVDAFAAPAAPVVPAKAAHQRKEPVREDYKTEEAFVGAWNKWRRSRNSNNKSVRRCRENFRSEKKNHTTKVHDLEQEQERLHAHLLTLVKELAFFNRAISEPHTLTAEDKAHLRAVVAEEMVKMDNEAAGIVVKAEPVSE